MALRELDKPILSRLSWDEIQLIQSYRASSPSNQALIQRFASSAALDTASDGPPNIIPLVVTK